MAANSGRGYCIMYRLVKDCSETSGLQAQAMDSLQEKMKTLQSSIDQEKTAFVQAKVLISGDAIRDVLIFEHIVVTLGNRRAKIPYNVLYCLFTCIP